jgi:hypothetical protein
MSTISRGSLGNLSVGSGQAQYDVTMSVAGGGPTWTELVADHGTYTRRDHKKRAVRAGGYPPGSAEDQLKRALETPSQAGA